MRLDKFRIFDKKGSNLNIFTVYDIVIGLKSNYQNSFGAEVYAITNPIGFIEEAVIKSSGWEYSPTTTLTINDPYIGTTRDLTSTEASLYFVDVSVFNPFPSNSLGIGDIVFDISTLYYYPTNRFSCAIFTKPVSVDLVETEHLTFFVEDMPGIYIRPFEVASELVFKFIDGDAEIKLFEVDVNTQTIVWTDELIFDISQYIENQPIVINIGFKAGDEGVFERRLKIYHRYSNIDYIIGEVVINSQAIGKDARFDALISNFGLPDPKAIPHLFKEADINEANPDWLLLNYKSKHIILEHSQIMPYIGTYKALINAIKWLGYEDIKIKEWFRNVKDNTKLSLYVPYEAIDRTKTILYFTPDERKNLKKLNELTLTYCITRETGVLDAWGVPEVEECYDYNLNEILIKLKSLKEWLERYIIGVNARIVDITGEGVYFERFQNLIYATEDIGHRAAYSMSLTPYTISNDSELIAGDSSINLTLLELQQMQIGDFGGLRFQDIIDYCWDPSNGAFSLSDTSLFWDPSTIFVGPTYAYSIPGIYSMQWKASVEKTDAAVVNTEFVTAPLFIYENDIRFYNINDVSTVFYDVSANIDVTIEMGFLRDPSIEEWEDNISYSIYPNFILNLNASSTRQLIGNSIFTVLDGSGYVYTKTQNIPFNPNINPVQFGTDAETTIFSQTDTVLESQVQSGYVVESSVGDIYYLAGELSLQPDTSSLLYYAYDLNYKVPLFVIGGYKWTDINGANYTLDKNYYLEILDGNIKMEKYIAEPSTFLNDSSAYRLERHYINFNYDTSLAEQKITLNVVYESPLFPLSLYDPSIYYNIGPDQALVVDNSIYNLPVNYTGNYNIEVFGWNGNNTLFYNFKKDNYKVWNKYPTILNYLDTNCGLDNLSACHLSILSTSDLSTLTNANKYPIFDKLLSLYGLKLLQDVNDKYYISVPSISYFIDIPDSGSNARFLNLTEKCSSVNNITGNIVWDPDYQKFYPNDVTVLLKINTFNNSLLVESSANVLTANNNTGIMQVNSILPSIEIDPSSDVYLINDTERQIFSIENDYNNKTITIDVSNYEFLNNQLVNLIISDVCLGYTWGSAFRVLEDASLLPDPIFYKGITHKLLGNIPQFVEDNSTRYIVSVKHAWTTFVDFNIEIDYATEVNNYFRIYLKDDYFHQYYLDSTFVYINVPFDQNYVIQQWYDPSTDFNLIDSSFYSYTKSITIEPSTLVIFDSYYDSSNYLLNGKNIWSLTDHESNKLIFRVFNKVVPFIFEKLGTYDVKLESYDSYGNIRTKEFEGLIIVQNA